jgi:hypothetical protein
MAATRIVEAESGTFTGSPRNPHQGYYAGDFSGRPATTAGIRPVASIRSAAPLARP